MTLELNNFIMAIQFKIKDKPNHPIVVAIQKYEPNIYSDEDLITYSPHFDSTCGWTIEGHFLGFTIPEVIGTYERKIPSDTIPRFFVDLRSGCGAVRDRQHPNYNEDYQGLHYDTIDVVEYRHGFQNREKESWDMKQVDLDFLNERCDSLNGV